MAWKKLNSAVQVYSVPVYKADRPVMALSVLKDKKKNKLGVVREIVRREGDVAIPGYVDQSKLYIVKSKDGLKWERVKELKINGVEKIVRKNSESGLMFMGLEDPDIWIDEENKIHLYYTIAYKLINEDEFVTYLGHAEGEDLDSLAATEPVLSDLSNIEVVVGFKEVAISPKVFDFGRVNLVESGYWSGLRNERASTIIAAKTKDMGRSWEFLKTVADPTKLGYAWANGHLSPGPIFPESFISHKDLLVGIVNGREKTKEVNGQKIFGRFSIGLMLFNPRTGEIPWISSKPLISDPEARTITFASDFLRLNKNSGILYAHVDDSFVRAYKIDARKLIKFLPDSI